MLSKESGEDIAFGATSLRIGPFGIDEMTSERHEAWRNHGIVQSKGVFTSLSNGIIRAATDLAGLASWALRHF